MGTTFDKKTFKSRENVPFFEVQPPSVSFWSWKQVSVTLSDSHAASVQFFFFISVVFFFGGGGDDMEYIVRIVYGCVVCQLTYTG